MTETAATEKQIALIANLIAKPVAHYGQRAADARKRYDVSQSKIDLQRAEACELLRALWKQIVIPSDLTTKRASAWIDQLQKTAAVTESVWLDRPAAAAAFGVGTFIDANRDAIERAMENWS